MRRSTTDENAINEYSIIEAGFLYQQGNMLVTYIESKSDVFGNIPALDVPESDNEDESESDEEGEGAEKQEEKDSGEPKIEDEAEVAKMKKLESLEEEKVP